MKAIIPVGGYATRLYPLTLDTPKALLPIAGKPMMDYLLEKIEQVDDIDEVVVVSNDKFFKQFDKWASSSKSKKKITVLNDGTKSNEDRLGVIGNIYFGIEKGNINCEILAIAGDNLFEFDIHKLVEEFKKKKSSVVALIDLKKKEEVANKFGVCFINKAGKIRDFEEKPANPKSTLVATCCYIFSTEDIEEMGRCIRENRKPDNSGEFIKSLALKKAVYGKVFTDRWFDIGSHEQYREANDLYLKENNAKR